MEGEDGGGGWRGRVEGEGGGEGWRGRVEGEGRGEGWRGKMEGEGGGRRWTFVYHLSSLSNSVYGHSMVSIMPFSTIT